ncbi:MAG: hypothetical protein H7Y20_11720 [Bryobacteraceae bacterium]|nr:hypothetical protein [Bryobacteraceae bacterium]
MDTQKDAVAGAGLFESLGAALRNFAGFVLVVSLVTAPWIYGSTRHRAIILLCGLLTLMGSCWLVAKFLQKRKLELPGMVVFPILFLLLSGWLTVLTTTPFRREPFFLQHYASLFERWPGSFMVITQVQAMWLYSGLLVGLLVVIDLSSDGRWKRAFFCTMAVTGASIVILGILQAGLGANAILGSTRTPVAGVFFATFFRHTIAGAFVNLVWPLAAALLVATLCRLRNARRPLLSVGLWGVLALAGLCGIAAQTSRFVQVNALIFAVSLALWLRWRLKREDLVPLAGRFAIFAAIAACAMSLTALRMTKTPEFAERWRALEPLRLFSPSQPAEREFQMRQDGFIESTDPVAEGLLGPQRLAALTCLRMIPKAGLLGFGPGGWSLTYPRFTDDAFLSTFHLMMQFAHQDLLQAAVEWGLLGLACWMVLIAGGVRCGLRSLQSCRRAGEAVGSEEAMTFGAILSVCGVLWHGLIEFPLQVPSIQLYVSVLVGMLWTNSGYRSRRALPIPRSEPEAVADTERSESPLTVR